MTKAELTTQIAKKTGLDKETVLTIVEEIMTTIKYSLIDEEPVFLRGFGTFNITTRKEKTARNIKENKTVIIPEHNIPTFKPCPEFKKALAPGLEIKD